jgi:hypothetical protein
MKPFRSVIPFSRWLLRTALFAFLVVTHFQVFKTFNFSNVDFYFAAVYLTFSILLLFGGIFSEKLTVVSALVILVLALYQLIVSFTGTITNAMVWFIIPISISCYFLASGNRS